MCVVKPVRILPPYVPPKAEHKEIHTEKKNVPVQTTFLGGDSPQMSIMDIPQRIHHPSNKLINPELGVLIRASECINPLGSGCTNPLALFQFGM